MTRKGREDTLALLGLSQPGRGAEFWRIIAIKGNNRVESKYNDLEKIFIVSTSMEGRNIETAERTNSRIEGKKLYNEKPILTSAITYDSGKYFRAVSCLYSGFQTDGHFFVREALARGAVAVVSERFLAMPTGIPGVLVPDNVWHWPKWGRFTAIQGAG